MFTKFIYLYWISILLQELRMFRGLILVNEVQLNREPIYCTCMPYWQCHDNYTGLSDIVTEVADVRLGSPDIQQMKEISTFTCKEQFHVCCKIECGRRRLSNYVSDEYGFGTSYELSGRSSLSPFLRPRILGGDDNEAEFGEFPWMLGILRNGTFKCGGSLIHPRVALTAAHCVYGRSGSLEVRAGEWDWQMPNENPPHQNRFVKMIIIHNKYIPSTVQNDIAMLVTDEPFDLTYTVGVVCIPFPNTQYRDTTCTASGWGESSYYGGGEQTILRKTDLPLVEREECTRALQEARLGPRFFLDQSFICAGGEEDKDTCRGDGGSPLVCPIKGKEERVEQVGIVSWGLKCGLKNTPGVYVNVAFFSDWIDSHMRNLGFDTSIYRHIF
ncbi:phenoloxidase-activating factor 2-like [Harmonia axyridis]|uniref:phenoloxidase-activating factor 2-like n=1 Tax=Harmonia axyridis TaxID=115357 RepID=UPI001E275D8B|nr:phenoloxidase-activating factor 2-like [Harmonia axyridis]